MNPIVQQPAQDVEPTPGMAFKYMGDLISEYMKTLPQPVRAPVIGMVNQSTEIIGRALNEWMQMKQAEVNIDEDKQPEIVEEE